MRSELKRLLIVFHLPYCSNFVVLLIVNNALCPLPPPARLRYIPPLIKVRGELLSPRCHTKQRPLAMWKCVYYN